MLLKDKLYRFTGIITNIQTIDQNIHTSELCQEKFGLHKLFLSQNP